MSTTSSGRPPVKKRQSLPSTIASSTKINQSKVERRKSIRRQSLSHKNPNFSPPETRSAKKKKIVNSFLKPQPNVLSFSPPNQKENERRELEERQRAEAERKRRIEDARQNGRLLVFSPSNRALSVSSNLTDATNASASSQTNHQNDELLKKLSEDVSVLAKNQAQDRRLSDAALLEQVQTLISQQNTTTDEKLRADLKDAHEKHLADREAFATERAQLNLQASNLGQLRVQLEAQVFSLQSDKEALSNNVSSLEATIRDAESQLHASQRSLEECKAQQQIEIQKYETKLQQVTENKGDLAVQLREIEATKEQLEKLVESQQQQVDKLQTTTIPSLQSALELERDSVARLETKLEDKESELEVCNGTVVKLQSEIEALRLQNQAQTDSTKQVSETLRVELASKNEQIATLQNQVQSIQSKLETQIRSNESLAQSKQFVEAQLKELNDALEESMGQLDTAEKEKTELESNLAKALDKLKRANEASESKVSETANIVQGLTTQLASERERREQSEHRLVETEQNTRDYEKRIKDLEKQLKSTVEERDAARSNMMGFDDREADLYRKLSECNMVRREMHGKLMQLMGNIRVFVRVRPALASEQQQHSSDKKRKRDDGPFRFPGVHDRQTKRALTASASGDDLTKNLIEVQEPYKDRGGLSDRRKTWRFGFDNVFGPDAGQEDVWENVEPLIQSAVDGFNVTLFAYGQTGSGKTFTMLGESEQLGIIGRSVHKMFEEKREIETLSRGESTISLSVELLEVYNEKVRDLLSPEPDQDLKVTSNEVVGNIVVQTKNEKEVMKVIELAQSRRCVKATSSNAVSSRSHMIFTLHFVVSNKNGERAGKLNICDLAGSERLSKSGAHNVGVRGIAFRSHLRFFFRYC